MTGASPLPTLEGERFQSRSSGKRDGIHSNALDVGVVRERVVINVGEVVWSGWIFEDSGLGLFLEGQHWGEVDLRTGYKRFLSLLIVVWFLFWILQGTVLDVRN